MRTETGNPSNCATLIFFFLASLWIFTLERWINLAIGFASGHPGYRKMGTLAYVFPMGPPDARTEKDNNGIEASFGAADRRRFVQRIWRILKWTGVALLASLALVWVADSVSVQHRMAHKTSSDPVE